MTDPHSTKSGKKEFGSSPKTPGSPTDGEETKPSYIAPDLVITGQVSSSGDVYVGGVINGTLKCRTLYVVPKGTVQGEACVSLAHLEAGSIFDGVLAAEKLGVKADAVVSARILTGPDYQSLGAEPVADISAQDQQAAVEPPAPVSAPQQALPQVPLEESTPKKQRFGSSGASRAPAGSPFEQTVPAE